MILRKPYALLIKNFKKIHFVLAVLVTFILFKCNEILTFFKEYIAHGSYAHVGDLASQYIGEYLYIAIILVVVITIVVFVLMVQKKKPTLLYFVSIVFYIALLIYLLKVNERMVALDVSTISPASLRIYRDITLISVMAQYVFIAILFVRTVGFDIKKFNFGEDLQQLNIESSDNEEFELTVGIDTARITRGIRRQQRELKYFFIENFFVISIIVGMVVISVGLGLYLNYGVINRIYPENSKLAVNGLVLKVNSSYYTHNNYIGENISSKNEIYVIVNLYVQNNGTTNRALNFNGINLLTSGVSYSPVLSRYVSFSDLGIGYNKQMIKTGTSNNYIFVFEVDESKLDTKNLMFRYTDNSYISGGGTSAKYNRFKLSPISLDKGESIGTAKLGDKLWFGQSILKDTSLSIDSIEIANKFTYKYNFCIDGSCSDIDKLVMADLDGILIHFTDTYALDQSLSYMGINKAGELVKHFGKIKYTIDNRDYTEVIMDYTPSNYAGTDAYIKVPSSVSLAQKIELILNVRSKIYKYTLK